MAVEVGESLKSLKFLDSFGNGPVVDSFHHPLVQRDTIIVDDVSKELDRGLVELALLRLKEQVEIAKSLKHLHILAMFGQALGVYQDVIYVNQEKALKELLEDLMHEILEYGGRVY